MAAITKLMPYALPGPALFSEPNTLVNVVGVALKVSDRVPITLVVRQ